MKLGHNLLTLPSNAAWCSCRKHCFRSYAEEHLLILPLSIMCGHRKEIAYIIIACSHPYRHTDGIWE